MGTPEIWEQSSQESGFNLQLEGPRVNPPAPLPNQEVIIDDPRFNQLNAVEGDSAPFWPSNDVQIGTLPFPVDGREGGCVLPGGCGGNPFPAAPQEILVRAGALSGLGARARGRPPEAGEGLRAFARAASAPCRSLPALAPVRCSLVASLPVVPGLWNSCVCKLPREGRGYALVRRAHGPRKSSGACQSLEVAGHQRQLPRVQVHGPPSESLWGARGTAGRPPQRGPCNIPKWVEGR